MADQLPTVVTVQGLIPRTPQEIWATLLTAVAEMSPGYTANLPGSLIEDISSTDVAAIVLCDSFRVDLINCLTPYGCNNFILVQLGAIYGIPAQQAANTSVNVVFTGPVGYLIPAGFQIADQSYVYTVKDGGVINSTGQSSAMTAIAGVAGAWVVPPGTVTRIITSVPQNLSPQISVSNPIAGVPGVLTQNPDDYRTAVLLAGRAPGLGMPSYVKTILRLVSGVQPRLVSVVQNVNEGSWKIIVGGGDIYEVAAAIYKGLLDVSNLRGSVLNVVTITNAADGVVTTDLNHGYTDGDICMVSGITQGMIGINAVSLTVNVLTEKTFSTGVSTTLFGTYTTGGIVTPNVRNALPTLIDYPDVYTIPFVQPPQQIVALSLAWNTSALNFVQAGVVEQLAKPALVAYVNSVAVGQPLNLYSMQAAFTASIAGILAPELVTRIAFAVSINGIGVEVDAGTGIFEGDPESYFYTDPTGLDISVVQS